MIMAVHSREFNELTRRIDRIAGSQEQIFRLHAEYIRKLKKALSSEARVSPQAEPTRPGPGRRRRRLKGPSRKGFPSARLPPGQQRTPNAIKSALKRLGLVDQW